MASSGFCYFTIIVFFLLDPRCFERKGLRGNECSFLSFLSPLSVLKIKFLKKALRNLLHGSPIVFLYPKIQRWINGLLQSLPTSLCWPWQSPGWSGCRATWSLVFVVPCSPCLFFFFFFVACVLTHALSCVWTWSLALFDNGGSLAGFLMSFTECAEGTRHPSTSSP